MGLKSVSAEWEKRVAQLKEKREKAAQVPDSVTTGTQVTAVHDELAKVMAERPTHQEIMRMIEKLKCNPETSAVVNAWLKALDDFQEAVNREPYYNDKRAVISRHMRLYNDAVVKMAQVIGKEKTLLFIDVYDVFEQDGVLGEPNTGSCSLGLPNNPELLRALDSVAK